MKRINPYKLCVGAFIPNWLLKSRQISPTAKIVYGKMCYSARRNGRCDLSQEFIANDMKMSRRSIQRAITELKNENLIGTIKKGFGKTNEYVFFDHPLMPENSGGAYE